MTEAEPVQDVAGIDVGLTFVGRSSGVCRTGPSGEVVSRTYCDRLSRVEALGCSLIYSVLAIDAPVLPAQQMHYQVRPCEKVFVWGSFQAHCKPGESQVPGTGQALRRAGAETAHSLEGIVGEFALPCPFPRVFGRRNIVEAFPNAFLGVSLGLSSGDTRRARGEKFDSLYNDWLREDVGSRLQALLRWPREAFWQAVAGNVDHDERAALVCALTAICVLRGRYVAVGDSNTGFFFLPPWEVWQPWARTALDANRADRRLDRAVDVWIDPPVPIICETASRGRLV